MAVHDVLIARRDVSIVRKALSNPADAVSITDRVWITICRRPVIDTSTSGTTSSGPSRPNRAPTTRSGGHAEAKRLELKEKGLGALVTVHLPGRRAEREGHEKPGNPGAEIRLLARLIRTCVRGGPTWPLAIGSVRDWRDPDRLRMRWGRAVRNGLRCPLLPRRVLQEQRHFGSGRSRGAPAIQSATAATRRSRAAAELSGTKPPTRPSPSPDLARRATRLAPVVDRRPSQSCATPRAIRRTAPLADALMDRGHQGDLGRTVHLLPAPREAPFVRCPAPRKTHETALPRAPAPRACLR